MSKVNAAELLARVRKRKQELLSDDAVPAEKPSKLKQNVNPYLEAASKDEKVAAAKPRLALSSSEKPQRIKDDRESSYLPRPPESGYEWWNTTPPEITCKINRPPRVKPKRPLDGATIHLTRDEARRKRKQERFAKRQDAQERVRLGIDPPPQPKLKLSNVAAVFGAEFVQDPTKYELMALQDSSRRREAHERENRERQLTPEQRWAKHEAKMESHRERGIHSAVFRIESLTEDTGKLRFLVDYTAKKFGFTGIAQMGAPALVVVEGGEPEILKFIKLIDRKAENSRLLWSGPLLEPRFNLWSMHKLPSEALKREMLMRRRALPYYYLLHDV